MHINMKNLFSTELAKNMQENLLGKQKVTIAENILHSTINDLSEAAQCLDDLGLISEAESIDLILNSLVK